MSYYTSSPVRRALLRAEAGEITWEQADEIIAEWVDAETDRRKDDELLAKSPLPFGVRVQPDG